MKMDFDTSLVPKSKKITNRYIFTFSNKINILDAYLELN